MGALAQATGATMMTEDDPRKAQIEVVRVSYEAVKAAERMTRRTDRLIYLSAFATVILLSVMWADDLWMALGLGIAFGLGSLAGATQVYARMRRRSFASITSAYQEIELQHLLREEEDAE